MGWRKAGLRARHAGDRETAGASSACLAGVACPALALAAALAAATAATGVIFASAVWAAAVGSDSSGCIPAAGAASDTLRLRFEVGASTDVTNEQFYADAYLADTTFLGRRLVSAPETRHAGVLQLGIRGTRAHRALRYELRHLLSLGDLLQRGLLELEGAYDFAARWRFSFAPRGEVRHDRTFGRDLTEARGGAAARLRRAFGGEDTFAELGLGGDFLRTSGRGADFVLDRNAASVSLALDRSGLDPGEWRAGWSLALRSFPDSSERSHLEHGWEGRWRHVTAGGHGLTLEVEGARRGTLEAAPTTRDQFLDGRAALELELWSLASWSWRARAEGELLRYDHEDSVLYLDTRVARGRAGPRWQSATGWSLSAALRVERLLSPRDPGEEYAETGGELGVEWLGRRGWWSAVPAAGWREYLRPSGEPGPASLPGMHSSFAFYELTLFGDQSLPGALRLRVAGTGRLECHTAHEQDAGSLYFSVDLRRLF